MEKMITEFPQAMRSAMQAVTHFHVHEIIPRHFLGNARYVYKYGQRKPSYLRKKYAIITRSMKDNLGRAPTRYVRGVSNAEIVDLVYTGKFKNEALNRSRATATPGLGVVTIAGRVLNLPSPPGSHVDMNREMTTMTQKELAEVGEIYTHALRNAMTKISRSNVVGIRGTQVHPGATYIV